MACQSATERASIAIKNFTVIVNPKNQEKKAFRGFRKITAQWNIKLAAGHFIQPNGVSLLQTKKVLVKLNYWENGRFIHIL